MQRILLIVGKYFHDDVFENIVTYTNKELELLRPSCQQPIDYMPTHFEELLSFIGLFHRVNVKRGHGI